MINSAINYKLIFKYDVSREANTCYLGIWLQINRSQEVTVFITRGALANYTAHPSL